MIDCFGLLAVGILFLQTVESTSLQLVSQACHSLTEAVYLALSDSDLVS